ncbi:J domain-containing protein [Mycena indigotica]|uniref:J domain-containing protein n=1 Tax=Mycena indigotica TaxID=2126181 RepID=A0A8H6WEE6_9AGAR|nr:J domain-containing protein [Mycena indigotica]KAF7309384.1 J domain-containing protein [Mycena indigotica]
MDQTASLLSKMYGLATRFNHLPPNLRLLLHAYSTTSAQYPFPTKVNPSPHEIFHLQRGASEATIKQRYIELVKLYHPDSPSCRDVPPNERHRRFHLVGAAYDTLRGKPRTAYPEKDRTVWEEIERRKRAQARHRAAYQQSRRGAEYSYGHSTRAEYAYAEWNNKPIDGRWVDRVILAFGFTALIAGVLPIFLYPRHPIDKLPTSAYNLAQARREARLKYEERLSSDNDDRFR